MKVFWKNISSQTGSRPFWVPLKPWESLYISAKLRFIIFNTKNKTRRMK
jgi:hypothetical protein